MRLIDSLQVTRDELLRAQLTLVQCLLHLIDGGFFELKSMARWHWKQPRRAGILL